MPTDRKRKAGGSNGAAAATVAAAAAAAAAAAPPPDRDPPADDSDSSSAEDQEDEDDGEVELVDAEFDSVAAQKADFHGIKTLLRQLFRMAPVDIVDLADLIIEQSAIGCLLKQVVAQGAAAAEPAAAAAAAADGHDADDDDAVDDDADVVYALVTALNLKEHAKRNGVKSLMRWFTSKLGAEHTPTLQGVLKSKVALVVHERYINIPLQIAPLMYRSLQEDMAGEAGEGAGFPVDNIIMVIKSVEVRAPSTSPRGRGGKAKGKKARRERDPPAVVYSNPEEELLERHASFYHTFAADESKEAAMSDVRHKRSIVVLPTAAMAAFVAEIENAVPLADGSYRPLAPE